MPLKDVEKLPETGLFRVLQRKGSASNCSVFWQEFFEQV